nr:unnamed protein product [Digitaria exilis]
MHRRKKKQPKGSRNSENRTREKPETGTLAEGRRALGLAWGPARREQTSDHVGSTVQTCMKEYGFTVAQANKKLGEIVEEAWMDMVEESLDQKQHPMAILEKMVNLARTMDFINKNEDAYTLPHSLKDIMTSLYLNFA